MTTTQITYGKKITVIQENLDTNLSTIKTFSISKLADFVTGLDCFAVRLSNNVLNKNVNKFKKLGFDFEVDESYGFDWEVKLYCNKQI